MAGNPNQPSSHFDMHQLFKPPNSPQSPSPNPNPNPNYPYPPQQFHFLHHPHPYPPLPTTNSGAHLMALLGSSSTPHLDSAVSMPLPAEFLPPSPSLPLPTAPSAPPAVLAPAPSAKLPKGRLLGVGREAVYDVDVRLAGEAQPTQLEVTPITKYLSDPGLVLGRQIAVNRTYICYGLKLGAIRVLNINTALRALLRGHNQRVSDMAFFAEDVHLLASASIDGRIFVWRIDEGPDEADKPQITGKVILAIEIVTDEEQSLHPRICWHCHKQEVLVVGIGNNVLKIDTNKVGRGESFSAEEPLKCSLDKLIDGVQFVGKHDDEVTDLSMSQWMTTRLATASKDGMVKIWEDRKAVPLVTLRPHDGQPVNSVAFLTAPNQPDHIVLISAGPLNREVKVWASSSDEGWLLPSESESWHCTQTLVLKSSAEPRAEEAFFNQVVVLSQASLILLANAKKNAIYAVHVDYGPSPASTRMDYITEFTVTMPILSLTGTSECLPDGEQVVQVYCVQTQAIQQYALELSLCVPPPVESVVLERENSHSQGFLAPVTGELSASEHYPGINVSDACTGTSPKLPLPISFSDSTSTANSPVLPGAEVLGTHEATGPAEHKASAPPHSSIDSDIVHTPTPPSSSSPDVPGRHSGNVTPFFERPSVERKSSLDDIPIVPNNQNMFKVTNNVTHLITPSEILSGAVTSYEKTPVPQEVVEEARSRDIVTSNGVKKVEHEVKVVGENGPRHEEFGSHKDIGTPVVENKDRVLSRDGSESNIELEKDYSASKPDVINDEEPQSNEDVEIPESFDQVPNADDEDIQEVAKDVIESTESAKVTSVTQSSAGKSKKQRGKKSQGQGASSSSVSMVNSMDEPGISADAAFAQIMAMQEAVNQLMVMQKEMQKQISATVAVPVTKEGKRVEMSLGRNMEKAVKANVDALWARLQEENAKREKQEKDRMQQITTHITSSMAKDLPNILEKGLKKELSNVGPAVARALTPVIEKILSSAVADSFQRVFGDKAVSQLEKSVNSKVEVTLARQIQAQFQTSGKQALQEALRSTLESSVVPAFEQSCRTMFEQVDGAFHKGMTEHTAAAQKQFEATHTPLALTLRDAINSASSVTQNLTTELAEGQRKLLALVASGNQSSANSMPLQQRSDPLGGLPLVEAPIAPVDPTKELMRLVSERKFDEAFTLALQRSDVSIVAWLCSQVDLQGICNMTPVPLSQGVLLALLQQLACDLSKETPRKLAWMTEVAGVITPADPTIAQHVRPICEQIYQILIHQRSLPTTTPSEASGIRLVMHVINSVLISCK